MSRHTIPITNGKGSIELVTGTYNAQAVAGGYDASTLDPKSVTIIDGTDTYAFTISAKGTLTLHVTDTGEASTGVQIVGAKFIRTDSTGTNPGISTTLAVGDTGRIAVQSTADSHAFDYKASGTNNTGTVPQENVVVKMTSKPQKRMTHTWKLFIDYADRMKSIKQERRSNE